MYWNAYISIFYISILLNIRTNFKRRGHWDRLGGGDDIPSDMTTYAMLYKSYSYNLVT